ncbi:amidase family protein [Mycoplasma procyoni]|uniref:amidase family protein n=1 Tax=Mycoplasma procyoni TaxID=568784 RepID=UPI00197C5BDB|nr:amidase family protein [Mycoplasma procyoni]MBN3535053.1 Asp-tRNA(Asn)/Glu-tRNA(Gln) amidotransferase subunit GatA [Mycoplasma procyoni]
MIKLGDFNKALEELKNDKNNAVSFIFEKKEAQEGNLKNAVFTIKDVFATEDAKTQASSRILSDFQPSYNATVVQKLLNNGAVAVAKVHNDELALGGEGIYSYWGNIANPLDLTRKVGGSSSGSAATLTDNISFALGSDTGDSVRLPASFVGKVGFKPSYGAVSRYGMFAYSSSLDTVSWFAHNVFDVSEVAKAVFGKDSKDLTSVDVEINNVQKTKPKKVAFFDIKGKELLDPEVEKRYFEVIELFKKEGVEVVMIEPDSHLLNSVKPVYDIVSYSEASSNLSNLNGISFGKREEGETWDQIMTNTRSKGFGKMVQRRLILGSFFLEKENQEELFLRAQKIRRLIKNYLDKIHSEHDLLIFPASPTVAPVFDDKTSHGFMNFILTSSNLAGNPSLTMKIGQSQKEKLPFNITLDSKIYSDQKLLSFALWVEELLKELDK